nr:hypothetical protein LOC_Os03g32010 [Oryza sativa Japonica Group]
MSSRRRSGVIKAADVVIVKRRLGVVKVAAVVVVKAADVVIVSARNVPATGRLLTSIRYHPLRPSMLHLAMC